MPAFLNSIILFALALSLIPIIIHLLNRKKSKLVVFSTLDFLKALQKKKMKKIRLRQILLLVIRTLILVMAVMAFARPVLITDAKGQLGSHGETSVVFVIDNSIASSYVSEKGMILDIMKIKARQISDLLKEGDEWALVTSAEPKSIHNIGFSKNLAELKARISDISYQYGKSDMSETLFSVFKATEGAHHINRVIYVFSLFQASSFNEEKIKLPKDVKIVFIDCSVQEINNVGISDLKILNKIIEKNKPVEIRSVVKNFSRSKVQDLMLNVYLNGKRAGQTSLNINGEDEAEVNLKITPDQTGYLKGFVEIDDDPFTADNRRYFHLFIPSQINVLITGENSRNSELVRLALDPSLEKTQALIHASTIPAKQLPAENLSRYDVLILTDVSRFDDALMRKLQFYLKSGKGLVLIPGDNADITNYNIFLSSVGLGKITGVSDFSSSSGVFSKFGRIDHTHPIVKGMFDHPVSNERPLESPNFIKYFKTEQNAPSKSIITYSDNSPFMEESSSGKDRVLFFTSAADLGWSDWPLKGVFVALINRSVNYLFSQNSDEDSYGSGENVVLRLSGVSGNDVTLRDPNDTEIIPQFKQVGEDAIISLNTTGIPGSYVLKHREDIHRMVEINLTKDQINLVRISSPKLEQLFTDGNLAYAEIEDSIEKLALQSEYGTELWKWFVLSLLILLVAEMLIGQNYPWDEKSVVLH